MGVRAVALFSQRREMRSRHVLTHNRYRGRMQPATVALARDLAGRALWTPSSVWSNDTSASMAHRSASKTSGVAAQMVSSQNAGRWSTAANVIGASKIADAPDRVCRHGRGLHSAAPAVGPPEPPSALGFVMGRDLPEPHPIQSPPRIPVPMRFSVASDSCMAMRALPGPWDLPLRARGSRVAKESRLPGP
jgi:hypothetical protein